MPDADTDLTTDPAPTATPPPLRHDLDGVATLTLNRPDAYNTLTTETIDALQAAFDAIAEDPQVRVVVLAAAGKAFCVGHDLNQMMTDPDAAPMQELFEQCSAMMTTITRLPQPVIARVHGVAAAAGVQLVAQCDLAVAAEEASFATSGIKLGLFCATPMVPVTRNLPRKKAFEMLMTGDLMDAREAEALGLVNRVVPAAGLDAAIADLAERIIDKSPLAVRRGKELFYRQMEEPLEAAYADATKVITNNMQDRDARAGIAAFLAKADMPDWKGE